MKKLDPKLLTENIDTAFDDPQCAAKLNVAFNFVLKNVRDGRFWQYYAHEKYYTFGTIQSFGH